jgi:hypothetical protein
MIFLETLLTQIGHFISGINPVVIEILKIFSVSIGWIGGLAFFMWKRDQNKTKKGILMPENDMAVSEAA